MSKKTFLLLIIVVTALVGLLFKYHTSVINGAQFYWVILSAMFPNNISSVAMSIAVAAQWAANYAISQSFPVFIGNELNNNAPWNGSLPYFISIAFHLIIVVITYRFIPESKVITLEEIADYWRRD